MRAGAILILLAALALLVVVPSAIFQPDPGTCRPVRGSTWLAVCE